MKITQAGYVQIGSSGDTFVAVVASGADGESNDQGNAAVKARPQVFNGTTWDRLRGMSASGYGLGVMAVSPRTPGASDTIATFVSTASNSTTRATLATPSSDKKIRVASINIMNSGATGVRAHVYFGTGASVNTSISKWIFSAWTDVTDNPTQSMTFPDGAGPVGAANDVVSILTSSDISGDIQVGITFREE